jgi:sugar phosphate isomerase/epimerase
LAWLWLSQAKHWGSGRDSLSTRRIRLVRMRSLEGGSVLGQPGLAQSNRRAMPKNLITVFDYDFDFFLKDKNVEPRPTPGALTREEILTFLGTLGVDGVELRHDYWSDYSAAELRNLAADSGLPIVCYLFDADLAVPSAQRHAVVDKVYSLLERTAALGARRAFFIPCLVKPQWPTDQQKSWLIDGLRVCAERAHSLGVLLLSENIDWEPVRPLMGRGSDCRKICAEVDSPGYRLIYDMCAPLFVHEDSVETLRTMAPYVVHVHCKNSRPVAAGETVHRFRDSTQGIRYTGTVLDQGSVPVAKVLSELKRIHYTGYFQIEYQGELDPREAIRHNLLWLRAQMKDGE